MGHPTEIRMCWSCVAEVEPPCETCWRLKNIGSNLAVAASLCAAWESGRRFSFHALLDDGSPFLWKPGCGRSAP
jgi:hypothetical protein